MKNKCGMRAVRIIIQSTVVTLQAHHWRKMLVLLLRASSRAVEPPQGCCYIVFAINIFQGNVQPKPTQ